MTYYLDGEEEADKILSKIRFKRDSKGLKIKDLASYLSSFWNVGQYRAGEIIRKDIESPHGFVMNSINGGMRHKLSTSSILDIYAKRFSDYLSSLGISQEESIQIINELNSINSNFNYFRSQISPLIKV